MTVGTIYEQWSCEILKFSLATWQYFYFEFMCALILQQQLLIERIMDINQLETQEHVLQE